LTGIEDTDVLLSCFLPVYNAAPFLKNWWEKNGNELESVGAKIVVVDNGSTDSTIEIIEAWRASDLVLLRHSENIGLEASFKTAKGEINSKYRILLPADDWVAEGYLADALQILERETEVRVVYGNSYMVDMSSGKIGARHRPPRPIGRLPESPFSPLAFTNFITDISIFRSDDLDTDPASSRWFAPGMQASILLKGDCYFTGRDQCFSGKRWDQESKSRAKTGQLFLDYEDVFSGFYKTAELPTPDILLFQLLHQNFYLGMSLWNLLGQWRIAGHPYLRTSLTDYVDTLTIKLITLLVDELLVDAASLQFKKSGRLGSLADIESAIEALNNESLQVLRDHLQIRGCPHLIA
jgi:glycosyltransferase involved in cell wall biosynthesis